MESYEDLFDSVIHPLILSAIGPEQFGVKSATQAHSYK